MGNKAQNLILITMGLIMICLFFIVMIHPRSTDAALMQKTNPQKYYINIG